ncbi:MAG: membrane integrity-associated transporter subunit PqiC [Acetobacter sp.]|nr:membrane integrity-associated transporter subunit PqiC [Acetobacter sp.]
MTLSFSLFQQLSALRIATKLTKGIFIVGGYLLLTGCAGPPLRVYTLNAPPHHKVVQPILPLSPHTPVITISHVVLPDYLDSQDMLIRHREEIQRKPSSRWSSRLSIGITNLITNELANFHPSELVTDQPFVGTPTLQIQINISRFDVTSHGHVVLDANWFILPSNLNKPIIRSRVQIRDTGSVATPADIATLMRKTTITLASKINASLPLQQ